MKSKTCVLVLAFVLVTALAFASGGKPSPTGAASEDVQLGGTLKVIWHDTFYYGGPGSWDIDSNWLVNGRGYSSWHYNSLLVGDWSRGPSGTGETMLDNYDWAGISTGELAESWDIPNPKTFIFHLRKGVKFHDKAPAYGRELTADDVVYTFKRQKENFHLKHLTTWMGDFTTIDKYTVKITSKDKLPFWQYTIGYAWYGLIYPHEVVEKGMADWKNACGAGAFMLHDHVDEVSTTWVPNPDYFKDWTDPKTGKTYDIPMIDKLVAPSMTDESTILASLRTGKVDIWDLVRPMYTPTIKKTAPELLMKQNHRGADELVTLRWDLAPTDDIRVRKALSYATNRQAIADTIHEGMTTVEPQLPVPPGSPGLYPVWPDEWPQSVIDLWTYQPDKAKQLLKEAGYADGFTINVQVEPDPTKEDTLAMIKEQWAEVGVEMTIEVLETALAWKKREAGEYEATFHGRGATPGKLSAYTAPGWYKLTDELIAKYTKMWEAVGDATGDADALSKASKALVIELQKDVAEGINIPLPGEYMVWQPWVRNYNGELASGCHDYSFLKYAWIDRKMMEEKSGRTD